MRVAALLTPVVLLVALRLLERLERLLDGPEDGPGA